MKSSFSRPSCNSAIEASYKSGSVGDFDASAIAKEKEVGKRERGNESQTRNSKVVTDFISSSSTSLGRKQWEDA